MGGASKLLSLLVAPFPLLLSRRRPIPSTSFLLLTASTSLHRRHVIINTTSYSPQLRRTHSTTTAAAAAAISHDTTNTNTATPDAYKWSPPGDLASLLGQLAAAAGEAAVRDEDRDAFENGGEFLGSSLDWYAACHAFARERPELLRSLSKKDVEIVVKNGCQILFNDSEASTLRLVAYISGDEINGDQAGRRAETVDIMRYLLSYVHDAACAPENSPECKELVEPAVRNLLVELIQAGGNVQASINMESASTQPSVGHVQFSRPLGQNVEMKRGDWICPKCSFMNFARNASCLECNDRRPKKILTGGEWECPQCDFLNYGRNMSCLRCDCKRPGEIPLNSTSASAILGYNSNSSVEQVLDGHNTDKSEIEKRLEKAERWLSKVSQLDDSSELSSPAAEEDFPEIMPMRKGDNRFVVSTRKTPLERRLANTRYNRNNATPQADRSSDPTVSQTLDRILGRSPSSSRTNNQSATGKVNAAGQQNSMNQRRNMDSIPFVPLPSNMFAEPHGASADTQPYNCDQVIATADNSATKSSSSSNETRYAKESSDGAEKWSNQVSELDNTPNLPSSIPDDDFSEIMPMRKGENRFVVSKKKDRSLTSPQYKRRTSMEQANSSNFVPFVPFPPGYFAKKDQQANTGTSQSPDKAQDLSRASKQANATAQSFGTKPYTPHVLESQSRTQMNTGSLNTNYSQQSWNESKAASAYGENANYSAQPTSQGFKSQSNTQNTQSWTTNFSQGSWNHSNGGSAYVENASYSAQQSNVSGYSRSNDHWDNGYSYNNNASNAATDTNPMQPSSYSNSGGSWNGDYSNPGAAMNPAQPSGYTNPGASWNGGNTGKSLEGSAVKESDPLDMSEEAKAERWFRRAAQIKDISELASIPDEDFPEIMPMRKGVNRFVVSKRKTPLERRLTSPQYRRNLPIISSEPEKDNN